MGPSGAPGPSGPGVRLSYLDVGSATEATHFGPYVYLDDPRITPDTFHYAYLSVDLEDQEDRRFLWALAYPFVVYDGGVAIYDPEHSLKGLVASVAEVWGVDDVRLLVLISEAVAAAAEETE